MHWCVQLVWLTYEVLRPQLMGYDAFFAFPHAWYWSSVVLMILQLGAFILQRNKKTSSTLSFAELTPITLTGMVQP